MTSSMVICSPPVNVYSESHQRQRRLHPVSRTKAHGRPACDDSPWMEWKISVTRSMVLQFMLSAAKHLAAQKCSQLPAGSWYSNAEVLTPRDPSLRSG